MKIIILLLIVAITLLVAKNNNLQLDTFVLSKAYEKQFKGYRSNDDRHSLLNDSCYKEGAKYLTSSIKMKEVSFNSGDAEIYASQLKKIKKMMPDYENALHTFYKCVKQNSNPIAAYSGLTILNNYLGKNTRKKIQAFSLFSEVLYKDKSCMGYLNYGDVFYKGIGNKVDKTKALKLYKEGQKQCTSDWYSFVLQMRVNNASK